MKWSFSIMNDSFWAHKVVISKPRDWIMKACLRIPQSGPRKAFTKMFSCSTTSTARLEARQELTCYESLVTKQSKERKTTYEMQSKKRKTELRYKELLSWEIRSKENSYYMKLTVFQTLYQFIFTNGILNFTW